MLITFVAFVLLADLTRLLWPVVRGVASELSNAWRLIPPYAHTFLGLFIVVVVVGVAGQSIYLAFEGLVLVVAFGRSQMGAKLRRLARQEYRLLIDSIANDTGITHPFAVFLATSYRIADLGGMIHRLRNIDRTESRDLYLQTVTLAREGWQDGLESSILENYLRSLNHLAPPDTSERLVGQIVVANVTYLLGDLWEGKRVADRTMSEAEHFDRNLDLPVYQWLASYAHANSRLFLGQFEDAIRLLGERWRQRYCSLGSEQKNALLDEVRDRSTVDPVASVPRHILLASAFRGCALMSAITQPHIDIEFKTSRRWASVWYILGLRLSRGETISTDFTHAYAALYCLTVEHVREPEQMLARIPPTSPPVSQYVKHGVKGLHEFSEGRFGIALKHLRQADAYSRLSGNRFFEGVFLPAHAAAAALTDLNHLPEVSRNLRRAKARARLGKSVFYDSQIAAARAAIAAALGHNRQCDNLILLAERVPNGLVRLYKKAIERYRNARSS